MMAGKGATASVAGVLPVIQTPFNEDESIDFGALAHEVEWAIQQGVDGLTVAMVSEYLRLSDDERIAVGRATVEAAAGLPVIVSVGAESTAAARALAIRAEEAGAAALMAIPPIAARALDDETERYYEDLLAAVELPIIVQDASSYVGAPLPISMQASLLDRHGPRVMFKPEAEPIGPRLTALREGTNGEAKVFEGTGGIALIDSYRRGVVGTMPAVDVCWALVALWRALVAGEEDAAYRISGPLAAMVAMQSSLDAYVAIEKHLLVRQGVLPNEVRRGPVDFDLDAESRAEIDRLLDRLRAAVALASGAPEVGPELEAK